MDDNEKTELEELRAMRGRLDELIRDYELGLQSWYWTSKPHLRAAKEQTRAALYRVRGDET